MKRIQLTQGQFALVSNRDFETVNASKWQAVYCKRRQTFFAQRTVERKGIKTTMYMARFILGVTDPRVKVDHKNHNTLDNRRSNIRPCTHLQNCQNRGPYRTNTSGFKGVSVRYNGKFQAFINHNTKRITLGTFNTIEEAALAYNRAAAKYHGKFAFLNSVTQQGELL